MAAAPQVSICSFYLVQYNPARKLFRCQVLVTSLPCRVTELRQVSRIRQLNRSAPDSPGEDFSCRNQESEMKRTKTGLLLAGVLSLLLWPASTAAQGTSWKKYMEAAGKAYQQARYAEAEQHLTAALKQAEKFGEQDRRFATSLNNLALLYDAQGKYVEAEPLYKRSLAIYEKALGPEHPRVAGSLNYLAALYDSQGKYAEAEPLYKRSLAIVEKALGPDHPNVALMLKNYAVLLRKMDRDAEAKKMEARAQAIRARHAGENP